MIREISIKERLILDLYTVGAIKFGKFRLKSGVISPYYLDLRLLVSYPFLLELTAEVFWEKLRLLYFDVIVGVPYAAIPIATAIAIKHNRKMVFVRKEKKKYGTKKLVEGEYHAGQKAVVIDDVITNGESKIMTIKPLRKAGLSVEDVVILLNRGQGGERLLKKRRLRCDSIFEMEAIFDILLRHKMVSEKIVTKCMMFMEKTKKLPKGKKIKVK